MQTTLLRLLLCVQEHAVVAFLRFLLLGWATLRGRGDDAIGDPLELPGSLKVAIRMGYALPVAESIALLDVVLACVRDLENPRAGYVEVLGFLGLQDLLDLRFVRDAVRR